MKLADETIPDVMREAGLRADDMEWITGKLYDIVSEKQRKLWIVVVVLICGAIGNMFMSGLWIGTHIQQQKANTSNIAKMEPVVQTQSIQLSAINATVNEINQRTAEIERRMDERGDPPHKPTRDGG